MVGCAQNYWVDAELDAFDESANLPKAQDLVSRFSGSGLVSIQIDYCPEGRLAETPYPIPGVRKIARVGRYRVQTYSTVTCIQRGFTVIDAGLRGFGATVEWLPYPWMILARRDPLLHTPSRISEGPDESNG